MSNNPMTINGVPIIYEAWLPTDDKNDGVIYVRNVRPTDDIVTIIETG